MFQKQFVFKWNGDPSSNWNKESSLTIELPMDTVLEVEYVQELRGEVSSNQLHLLNCPTFPPYIIEVSLLYDQIVKGRGQRRVTCVHVIDAMFLGGLDIRKLHFTERYEETEERQLDYTTN